jgi:Putative polyhydroxyalkanoic acid system protein (PHA_gran_rgn)
MSQPIDVDLPHKLGKEEARRRIANNIHKLQEHIPGGAQVESGWTGDQLNLDIAAMGQSVQASIDVEETKVHVRVVLPGFLAMFAAPIQAMLQNKGDVLLEDHHKG